MRVCKQWRSLALPFLYESLFIGRGRALYSLSSALTRSREKASQVDEDRALGWWTKRIDVVMRDHIHEHDVATELALLYGLFQRLPNLAVITFNISATYSYILLPAVVLCSIANTCGTRLQALTWHSETLIPSKQVWQTFLTKTPNIKTIWCPTTIFVDPSYPVLDGSVPELRFLTNLSIHILPEHPIPLYFHDLPSLRRLSIDGATGSNLLLQSTVLAKYSENLEVLQISASTSISLPQHFFIISQECPNLPRLDLSFLPGELKYADWSCIPESIQILGIQYDKGQTPKSTYTNFFDSLTLCRNKPGTKLKVIQLMDQSNVRDLCERHHSVMVKATERLKNISLELHDHEGRLIQ